MRTPPKKKKRPLGRPKTGRIRTVCRFTASELDRLSLIRKGQPRGVFLGRLIMAQPLNPFDKFRLLHPKG